MNDINQEQTLASYCQGLDNDRADLPADTLTLPLVPYYRLNR